MPGQAMFGKPVKDLASGGTLITVHVVPVLKGKLVVFELDSRTVTGSWLPWTTMDYGDNPYVTASAVVDEWCDGAMRDLRLVDVISLHIDGDIWELAIVFRTELTSHPEAAEQRTPVLLEPDQSGRIGRFDQVDLERWVGRQPPTEGPAPQLF